MGGKFMMKYIKFLKKLVDTDTNLIIKVGDIKSVEEFDDKELGKCYFFIQNEQKYCIPEKYNNGQFEIVRGEEN
jgi:hypothetical protein